MFRRLWTDQGHKEENISLGGLGNTLVSEKAGRGGREKGGLIISS